MAKKIIKKREIKEENVNRSVVVCYDNRSLDETLSAFTQSLRSQGIKFDLNNNIVVYKLNRTILIKRMFLTVNQEEKLAGRKYNTIDFAGSVEDHPRFKDFMEAIKNGKVLTLFND